MAREIISAGGCLFLPSRKPDFTRHSQTSGSKTPNNSSAPARPAAGTNCAVPFALTCQTLTVAGNATAGHHPAADHRQHAPGYTTKTHSPTADMFHKIRRVLITVKYQAVHPGQTTPAELHTLRPTWEIAAA